MGKSKTARRIRIKRGIRRKISGTSEQPRLSVFRSNKEIYGQLIDDLGGTTICATSSKNADLDLKEKNKLDVAFEVGKAMAAKANEAGITQIVFDRNGFLYHGRVKAFAEGVRKGGLKF